MNDIAFYIGIVLPLSAALLWELIPDGNKEYWKYQRSLKRDKKENRRRKYSFHFRIRR